MKKLPTTYEKLSIDGWDVAVSSSGHELIGPGGERKIELKWIAVATKLPMQVYPREPRTFPTREEALSKLTAAIRIVDQENAP